MAALDLSIREALPSDAEIIAEFNADPNAVFLCGFSRGAIGVNYLGLRDDEVAKLWTAFITHDHFDGVRQWTTSGWGGPLGRRCCFKAVPLWSDSDASGH